MQCALRPNKINKFCNHKNGFFIHTCCLGFLFCCDCIARSLARERERPSPVEFGYINCVERGSRKRGKRGRPEVTPKKPRARQERGRQMVLSSGEHLARPSEGGGSAQDTGSESGGGVGDEKRAVTKSRTSHFFSRNLAKFIYPVNDV